MTSSILADVSFGFYFSIWKLALYIALFFLWIPLINWVHRDAQAVRTDVTMWSGVMTATGVAALVLWLIIPIYLIGLLVYIIALGTSGMVYVIHRNARVAEFEKVLTPSHIRSLFVNEGKKIQQSSRGMQFITANNNTVPYPEPKTREAFGFQVACEIFEDAIWKRAGEILFQPAQQEYSVTFIIDGVPQKQEERSREDVDFLMFYIKQLADLDVNERRKPQTGPFKVERNDKRINFEATTAGSTAGEQLVIRRQEEYTVMKIDDLGMSPDQAEAFKGLRDGKQGLFIVSGPPKSGVTSTMYALLRNHDPFMNNINTLEKKPAAEMHNITQHSFNPGDTSTPTDASGQPLTYSRKLQTILRMGPDILGIADCEDKDSAFLACKGAADNKMIYITLESNGVMQALQKWISLVGKQDLVAETLVGISNQRLVRILCDQCKQAYQPNPDLLRKFNLPADKIKVLYRPDGYLYDKKGRPSVCDKCQGTGYYGRTGIFETIILKDELREAIKTAKSLQDIANTFRRAGMLYMQEQSLKKVVGGQTAINEVIREFTPQSPKKAQTRPQSEQE